MQYRQLPFSLLSALLAALPAEAAYKLAAGYTDTSDPKQNLTGLSVNAGNGVFWVGPPASGGPCAAENTTCIDGHLQDLTAINTASDSDRGTSIYSKTTGPQKIYIASNGQIQFTPPQANGGNHSAVSSWGAFRFMPRNGGSEDEADYQGNVQLGVPASMTNFLACPMYGSATSLEPSLTKQTKRNDDDVLYYVLAARATSLLGDDPGYCTGLELVYNDYFGEEPEQFV